MFDFVRKHNKIMQWLLFLLIFPSFVLFGLEGYNRYKEKGEAVAKVDGREITQQDWDNMHKQEVDRMRQQMPTLDAKLLDSPEAKYGTLERMVRERVLQAAVEHGHMTVSDQRLARELQRNELVTMLRKPDGTLDMERYTQLLAAQGMTPQMYENSVRGELATRQVLGGINDTGTPVAAPAAVALNSFFEKREAQVARFATADYQAKVEPSDTELEAFYKANGKLFQAAEQANVEWVMLDLASVSKGIALNEADLKTYYEQNALRLGGQEERRASHILISVPKGAPQADKDKAKAKAEELLAQVKKNPESFADVAKKNSQDPGSAPQGGDLDFFARGAMTKPFEDAAFALKAKGDISPVVESDFGFHIIKLTDLKGGQPKPFEELRPQIEAELKKAQAQKKYAEAAEAFSNGVYEQSDSLKPVADKLKLEIHPQAGVTRTPAPGATGPLANPKFLAALFGPEAVERKRNTEALEIGPNQMVSGRITKYTPATTRPFAEVKAQVREQVVAQRAAELARKEGQAKLEAWKKAPDTATLPPAVTVTRQDAGKLPRAVIEAALRADPAALPAWIGVDLGNDGYAVVKVAKVLPRDTPPAEQAKQEQAQYLRSWTGAETLAYYESLKARYKTTINVAKPKAALAE
ncbi:SurA N-terminal domain-containing protein [Ramlibacter sp. XY19]|uniref:peptidylprolyl isomerase n=1 Tax=Ramlibacter paludis TaxID=2908000 RepID=UPI0023DA6944|nr:SurA N-terminal domain-containing protein [Ramlibacter paludis]MCG2592615.1 SurA N-terminal domain-containing protein [Ramlibacter paludis]